MDGEHTCSCWNGSIGCAACTKELQAELEVMTKHANEGWALANTRTAELTEKNLQLSEAERKGRDLCQQNGELLMALRKIDTMRKRLPDPDFAEQKNTAAGIAEIIEVALKEKRVVPTPKCDSYWDGNQCEGDQGHEGKHRFMGWTWVVDPPPLVCCLCAAVDGKRDPKCACTCHKAKD